MKHTFEIRKTFLDFFSKKNHKILSGSSLVAQNDKTVLFTNSGMHQFKNVFLGLEEIQYPCVATAQRCIRAGGKHNDFNMVGKTKIHHTFFEMLGNFSFGAYFKVEAIQFAWELLTGKEWFDLPKERLLVTVYYKDQTTYDIWTNKTTINPKNVIFIKDKQNTPYHSDNFWTMGNYGPCGPCSEVFYCFSNPARINDLFLKDQCIEIWNLVFMQFNLESTGKLLPLPKLSIDTGMGLERIASVLQKVNSNYEIDIFKFLIQEISKVIKINDIDLTSHKIISDHIRAAVFLIYDDVIPSNSGRGYVLRRIIRRAILRGNIDLNENCFFYKLVDPVVQIMSYIDVQLYNRQDYIKKIIKTEEELFLNSIKKGIQFFNKKLIKIRNNILSGDVIFKLHDTYGFPVDLTRKICNKKNINFDQSGFDIAMKMQKHQSYQNSYFKNFSHYIVNKNSTIFCGFNNFKCIAKITAIYHDKISTEQIKKNQEALIILNTTTFYGESGGQIGDSGVIKSNDGIFHVKDTKKYGDTIIHIGTMIDGKFNIGNTVSVSIDRKKRKRITLNHSAIHLLHATLHQILGSNAIQKGSLVHEKYLSLDFSYFDKISIDTINTIEHTVNMQIRNNLKIVTDYMSLNNALNIGAIALFKEKYHSEVRVLKIGNFSVELCGGTHVKQTGEIGCFTIISEKKIAAEIHRIKAVTGKSAIKFLHNQRSILNKINYLMHSSTSNVFEKIQQMKEDLKSSRKIISDSNNIKIKNLIQIIYKNAKFIKNKKIIIDHICDLIDKKMLRLILNKLKEKLNNSIIILAAINNNQIHVVVSVAKEICDNIQANNIIIYFKKFHPLKGGGNVHFAEAVGSMDLKSLKSIFKKIFVILSKKI